MPTWQQIQLQLRNPNNPVVFLDVSGKSTWFKKSRNFSHIKFLVGNTDIGRMILELFADVVPKTSENFRQLCTGEYKKDGVPQGFKGSNVWSNFIIEKQFNNQFYCSFIELSKILWFKEEILFLVTERELSLFMDQHSQTKISR